MSIANIQQLSLNSEIDGERLFEYIIEKQKEYPQFKITVDDVLAIWEPNDALLSTDHDFVFLEIGYQHFDQTGKPLRTSGQGAGFCHILACHEEGFLSQGLSELFNHLHGSLLFGRILKGIKTYSILRVNGQPLITALVIGSNGFFVTAYPVTRQSIPKKDREMLENALNHESGAEEEDVLQPQESAEISCYPTAIWIEGKAHDAGCERFEGDAELEALVDDIEATYDVDKKGVDDLMMCLTNLKILRAAYILQRRHRLSTTFILTNLRSAQDGWRSLTHVSAEATTVNLRHWQAHQLLQLAYHVFSKYVKITELELEAIDLQSIMNTDALIDDARFEIATSSPRKMAS